MAVTQDFLASHVRRLCVAVFFSRAEDEKPKRR